MYVTRHSYGPKWSKIAAVLPGRTDDAVRNRYLRLQRKKPGHIVTSEDLQERSVAVGRLVSVLAKYHSLTCTSRSAVYLLVSS